MTEKAEELEEAIRCYRRVWLIYTMPIHVRAYHPDIWTLIQRDFENAEVFPGTLSGGEVFVCKNNPGLSVISSPAQISVYEHKNQGLGGKRFNK